MKFSTALAAAAVCADIPTTEGNPPAPREDNPNFAAHCYASGDGTGSSGSARRLDGFVVHEHESTPDEHVLPRKDVAEAVAHGLNGGKNFELQYTHPGGSAHLLYDLTRDGAEVSVSDASDLTGAFSVKNAFMVDEPDVVYTVNCPAVSDPPQPQNCTFTMSDGGGHTLVGCGQEESLLQAEDVPATCLDTLYDVTLKVFEHGPHFFVTAARRDGDAEGQGGCPRNVAFYSEDGTKKRVTMFESDLEKRPGQALGAATLDDLFRAEGEAEAPSKQNYHLVTNNCATYARDILRGAGLPETKELAQFYIRNLERNPDTLADMRLALGRVRSLALSVLRSGRNEGWLEWVVYSQLEIENL